MVPTDVAYEICRCYIDDQLEVDPALVARIRGFNRSRNLAGLASCSLNFDPAVHSVGEWRFLRQVEALFKKNSAFAVTDVTREAALRSFIEAEEQCSLTNIRLKTFMENPGLLDPDLHAKVTRAQRYISNVLGDFTCFLDALPNLVRVTPGATASAKRVDSLPQLKMRLKLFATRPAFKYLKAIGHLFGFENLRTKATCSNRIELVPKNWKTDRTIACEPEGNLPLQLAFDRYAKRRLRRYGINLSDQSANQKLAKEGSIADNLATVDFSKASDTVSFNAVSWLFPVDWFSFLFDVRSPAYRGVFGEGVYAKFSSMGNGSTFAIETLIFAAACYAVGSKRFSVYGDDVIIESEFFNDFIQLTRFLGFSVNEEKSYAHGPFRESCGADYYNGIDVTPVYLRSLDKRKANLCHIVNTLASVALPNGKLAEFLLDLIVEKNLPMVPHQEGTMTGVWIDPIMARNLGILRHWSWRGKHKCLYVDNFKAFVPKMRRRSFLNSRGYYLWFLRKRASVDFGGPWEQPHAKIQNDETSWAPVFDHCYVRKRVCWVPAEVTPDHLYWWSECVVGRKKPSTKG